MNTCILGIESSCDDTSVAILKNHKILSNIVCSQDVHVRFGGVVPELASRDHLKNIIPTIDAALKTANISLAEINAIATTRGPGLMGSLLVGISAAKSLSLALNVPLIEVNHIQAHLLAHFIEDAEFKGNLKFPFIGLIVSGGHTQLLKVTDYFQYELLGETLDDAAGEALDKGAKLLGLSFPGGPIIDKLALTGNPKKFYFPKSKVQDLHFSFSGIKTALMYFIEKNIKEDKNFIQNNLEDICASYQHTIASMLIDGLQQAIKETDIKNIAIAGGVSANSYLRKLLTQFQKETNADIHILPLKYCTDNAAMIAMVGYFKYQEKIFSDISITPITRWEGFLNK